MRTDAIVSAPRLAIRFLRLVTRVYFIVSFFMDVKHNFHFYMLNRVPFDLARQP